MNSRFTRKNHSIDSLAALLLFAMYVLYEEKSTDAVSHIVSILEPTIVIVLSILVGLVLLSVMMPLLGLLSEMIA